ncbi:MAG: hypothetical protein IPM50_02640 [Acidobacteriota bacterium]|nr:MAG: hypothetical protein IPM50_02640 [Acidobacteriota bacterium]
MGYGLKGKVREMVTAMQAVRKGSADTAGREVSLRQHMASNYKDANGNALTPQHLYAELGIDEHRTQVGQLLDMEDGGYLAAELIREAVRRGMGVAQREKLAEMNARAMASFGPITGEHAGGQRFVSPEVFLDPVSRGAVQGTFYPDIIAREIPVPQPQAIVPRLNLSDAALADSSEAATIEEGSISYDTKTVTVKKKARAIKIADEAVRFSSLSLLALFMEDFGRIFGHTLNLMAIDAIANDSASSTADPAAVIGVENTSNGITWYDLARVAVRFGLIGHVGTQIIGNETTALNYLNLPEVKNKQQGTPLLGTALKTPLTMPEELYVSGGVATSKVIIQDPSASIVQLTAQPLMVETARLVMKQITGTVLSTYTGFTKLQRKASVIVDGSIAFSGNGFPAWMTPLV